MGCCRHRSGPIEPNQLRALLKETIEQHLPQEQFEVLKGAEEYGSIMVQANNCTSRERRETAKCRQAAACEIQRTRVDCGGNLLEEGGLEMDGETAITLAVVVSAGKATPSVAKQERTRCQ